MPPTLPSPLKHRRTGRNGPGWDAAVAVILGVALLAGGCLDVRAYLSKRGKIGPAFRLVSTSTGERIGLHEFYHETLTVVHLGNIGRLEWDDPHDDRTEFRQALGPVSTVDLWTEQTRARVELRLRNPYPDQTVTVACNGQTVEEIHLDAHEEIARRYVLDLRKGANQFTLTFARFHPAGPGERAIAGRLLALDLYLPAADGSF